MPTVSPVAAFAYDIYLSITSQSLQSISCLTNGNWGPEVILKFIFSKPRRGGWGHLSYPLWPRYFQTFPGSLSWETILGCLLWHMFLVLKHSCCRPALSWTSFLLHCIFTNFSETGKKLLSYIGKKTKARETELQHCHTHNQEALVCSTCPNVIWERTSPFSALPGYGAC